MNGQEAESMRLDALPLPVLLRSARRVFSWEIRAALAEAGCADLPPNGPFVLGAIARTGAPLADVIRHLGVSKQTAGALVDTLVARGYLDRRPDPADRRRTMLALTSRGEAAAGEIRDAVDQMEASLAERVGERRVLHTRQTLAALIEGARND
jgi:DNA-binding MarR family transcriptional regulator